MSSLPQCLHDSREKVAFYERHLTENDFGCAFELRSEMTFAEQPLRALLTERELPGSVLGLSARVPLGSTECHQ